MSQENHDFLNLLSVLHRNGDQFINAVLTYALNLERAIKKEEKPDKRKSTCNARQRYKCKPQ